MADLNDGIRAVALFVLTIYLSAFMFFGLYRLQQRGLVRNRRYSLINSRKTAAPRDWYEAHFVALGLSFEASWGLCSRLGRVVHCDPTRFRPDDFVHARQVDGQWTGWCSRDQIDTLCGGFDAWLDALPPVAQTGTGVRNGAMMADVQTVADLIRWVEPFLTKKAKGTGLSDDDIG
jgi:hypothetical protein